jgi:nitrogen fixation/metabolism regulation signal transduction histidine kinase
MQLVDLAALLLDVLALYENLRPHIVLSLPSETLAIHGEPTRLRQVLHNLLQNAIDAQTDTGDPHFEITLEGHDDDIVLTFADAGAGVPDDVLTRAFEPYVTTKAKGTGLGLAIVKKIMEEHGGRVEIANRSPRGACVTLIFPRRR